MELMPPDRIVDGYKAYTINIDDSPDTTTDEYASLQNDDNINKTKDFLLPILKKNSSKTILDIGCGTGTMVATLSLMNYDAYGSDLAGLTSYWNKLGHDKNKFFIIDPYALKLPFPDNSLDFVFSLGAIEHVGTSDGHTDRLDNYKEIRKQWLNEAFRVVKVGGQLLIGGPNRKFPIDVAHSIDTKATYTEKVISKIIKKSVHFPWNENFLWAYEDIDDYLAGYKYEVTALSIKKYLYLSRVPAFIKPIVNIYLDKLPNKLLKSGLNPWVMALITKL